MRSNAHVSSPDRNALIVRLAQVIEAKQRTFGGGVPGAVLSTGWEVVDAVIGGGLAAGAVHEWFGSSRVGHPPLGVLKHLAQRAIGASQGWVAWIGASCWPYPVAMAGARDGALLERSIFIDARSVDERVWAADLALRCSGVAMVIADGSGLRLSCTRRLQLAAGHGWCLLARPPMEAGALSAARTRWRVEPVVVGADSPGWAVELLRCKGVRPTGYEGARWFVQRDHEAGDVRLAAAGFGGSAAASRSARRWTA